MPHSAHADASAPEHDASFHLGLDAAVRRHAAFLDWCKDNDVVLHDHLRLRVSSGVPATPSGDDVSTRWADLVHHGMCIRTSDDSTVQLSDGGPLAARIPKTAILSPRTSSLSVYDPSFVPCSIGGSTLSSDSTPSLATPQLALCLMHEFILGPASRFWPYLVTLPPHGVELPRMWDKLSPEYALLHGTEVGHMLTQMQATMTEDSPDHCVTDVFLHQYFFSRGLQHLINAHPALLAESSSDQASSSDSSTVALRLDHLHRIGERRGYSSDELYMLYDMAASLVSTRSFVIDFHHVLAMVPLADAFNHHPSPHVQLEIDEIVCTECGSFYGCEHDSDSLSDLSALSAGSMGGGTVDLRFRSEVSCGSEVFNSYGDWHDHELLVRYGFTTNQRVNTSYSWPPDDPDTGLNIEVARTLSDSLPQALRHFRVVAETRWHYPRMATEPPWQSKLRPSGLLAQDRGGVSSGPHNGELYICQDGSVCDRLWLLALASALEKCGHRPVDSEGLMSINVALNFETGVEGKRHKEAGLLAIKKLENLIGAKLARLRETYSDSILDCFIHQEKLSFAVRGAAQCNQLERSALKSCQAVLTMAFNTLFNTLIEQ